jgi:hypothetical protein
MRPYLIIDLTRPGQPNYDPRLAPPDWAPGSDQ